MSDLYKIVLTSCLTIFGGIFVYVCGKIIEIFYIGPIHEQSKMIGEIDMQLIYYSNIYLNPGVVEKEIMDETSLALRTLSGKLRALNHAIRCYGFWELMKIVPKRNDVIQASKELILLSNSVYRSEYLNQNIDTEKRIKELLNINL